jgi:hypothetical protein
VSPILQDVIVAAVAAGAAIYVIRRVLEAGRPEPAESGCDHCAINGDGSPGVENSRTPVQP